MLYGKKYVGTVAYLGGLMAVPESFCWAWSQLIQYNTDYLVEPNEAIFYDKATFSFHSYARNSIIERMKGDWLVMFDTDHVFDPDIVARLLNAATKYDLDVLSALYMHKNPPFGPVIYNFDGDNIVPLGDWERPSDEYLIDIGSAGAGTLFVRRRVFDRIKEELKEMPFDITHPYGEDHSFFLRLRKLGIQAYCAPYIESLHLQVRPVSLADYDPSKVNTKRLTKEPLPSPQSLGQSPRG